MICSRCRFVNKEDSNFCSVCGNKLKQICRCWLKKKMKPHNCGQETCPGYKLLHERRCEDAQAIQKENAHASNSK